MKHIDEYRDPALVKGLLQGIEKRAAQAQAPVTIMEVCGSHTNAIGKYGIRGMLPESIRLVSGPGCPVCVTSVHDIDCALHLAGRSGVVFATFGDMLRVPGTGGRSLQQLRAEGADIRIVASPTDCLQIAAEAPDREIVFMGIGFETTSPAIAAVIKTAEKRGVANFSVLSAHKVIPPAIDVLISDPALALDGFLCPGHVSIVIGADAYRPIVDAGRSAVITGFEPVDILEGVYMILGQIIENKPDVAIQYTRGVKREGSPPARQLLNEVFNSADARWRGLGIIPGSGLCIREEYQSLDALHKFDIPEIQSEEPKGCRCGDILRGIIRPPECPLFRTACNPASPVGPCMVSSEGTCAAYYKYH